MKRAALIIGLTGLLLSLSACATMSEEDCLTANWRAIGASDGAGGAAYSRLADRVQQCSEFGVQADLTAYNSGYEDGLISYCTPRNGFSVGSKGYSYNGVCPAEREPEFLAAYNEGRELYRLESALRSAENALESVYDDIDDREDDIAKLRKNQRKEDKALPADEYEERLAKLEKDVRRLKKRARERGYDLERARAALAAFTYRRW